MCGLVSHGLGWLRPSWILLTDICAKSVLLFCDYGLLPRMSMISSNQITSLVPSTRQRNILSFLPILWGLLLAIPVAFYCTIILKNAYNFPYEDDYNSALVFISDFAFSQLSVAEKIKLLFSQYNEHRIFFDRLVFLADYYLFGELSFRHLILFGNVAILLLGWLFFKASLQSVAWPQRLFYLLPVAYSLFLFQYWDLSTWAMAALQNLFVVVFAMFSLYKLSRPGRASFALACGAAVLATFTSGNGLFCFLAGIPLLILLKAYRHLIIWVVIGCLTVILYFWGYRQPPYHPDVADSLLNHPGRAIRYFLSLTGALFQNHPALTPLFGAGSLLLTIGLVGYLWYTQRLVDHLPIAGLLLFLYLTCFSLMATRSGFGVEQAFSTRYGIVVVMLYASQAVLAIETVTHRRLRLGVTLAYGAVAVLLFTSATNAGYRRNIEERTARLQRLTAQYHYNPAHLVLPYGDHALAKSIFDDAIRKGIYRVPNKSVN